MSERVILVDRHDAALGTAEKQAAHVSGALHRAFSIFVFNDAGELLLQRRSIRKYHSGGLWSNTCCSHPRPGEDTAQAAHRRLREELGFDCPLETACTFVYRADVGGGLIEHEYDHIFIGRYNGAPVPDEMEVEAWRWIGLPDLRLEARSRPDRFTTWFHIAFDELRARALV